MKLVRGLVCLTAMTAATVLLPAAECDRSPGFYEREAYIVSNIRLRGPLRHFRFVREAALRAGLPLRPAAAFQTTSWSLGTASIQDRLRDPALLQRFDLIFVTAGIENCSQAAKSLDAVYNIFAFSIPAGLSFDSQSAGQMVARSLVTSGLSRLFSDTFPKPVLGYNAARGLYGGTALSYQPSVGGFFDQADIVIIGSGSSLEAVAELSGARSRNRGLLRDQDWGVNYRYSDVRGAADNARAVRDRLVTARFGTFTRPLGPLSAGLRFGAALQGGSGQTDAAPFRTSFRNSATAGAKLYAGATVARGPYLGRLSYGVQRTQPKGSGMTGFFKSVMDTRHELRFLLAEHRPISIEMDAGAGWMPNDRTLPVQEAFFGGNAVRPFVIGDPWELRADPLFRGLPQLSVSDRDGGLGANRFASLNATAAFTIFGRPLVPQEVLSDTGFSNAIQGQLTTAETALSSDYIAPDAAFPAMAQSVAALKPEVAPIQQRLGRIRDGLPQASRQKVEDALSSLDDVDAALDSAAEPPGQGQSPTVAYRTLASGFGEADPPMLGALATSLRDLKTLVAADDASWLEENANRFASLQITIAASLQGIEARAIAKAHKELIFARRVVDSLLHEINIVSISPLVMFDVARFGWQRGTPSSTRYAIGPGIRFSLVNVNVSVGYAFNVRGPADTPRGALLFQFTVSDLFR